MQSNFGIDSSAANPLEQQYDDLELKKIYEDHFIERKVDQNNMPIPPPYELFLLYRDGKREKLDPRLNKRLGKTYDMANVHRIDVEFPMSADFT